MGSINRVVNALTYAPADPLKNLTSALNKLWKKVTTIATAIFAKLSVKEVFSKREITLIRNVQPQPHAPHDAPPLKDRNVEVITPPPINPDEEPAVHLKTPVYIEFDESLEDFRGFLRDFSTLCVDTVFESQVADQIDTFQNMAPSLPPVLKSFVKLIIEIGDKAAKPIFQKFSQQKAQIIDPTLKKIFKTLLKPDPTLTQAQQIDDRTALYETLLKQISTELHDLKIPTSQNLKNHYIQPILSWLLLSDHSIPLAELFGPGDRFKEDIIDKVFERSIGLLVERKIDQYARVLERTMQRRLGEIVHNTMRINGNRIADFFSERIAELISSMSFQEMYDRVIHDVAFYQVEGVIKAENAVEEHRKLIEKAQRAVRMVPKTPEETASQQQAKNYLESVAQHGGQEAFLRHIQIEKYSEQPICSINLKQMIEQEIALTVQGNNPIYSRLANEKAIFSAIADNILNLLTATKKQVTADGTVEEIDPFVELWERLYFPEELQEVIKHASELVEEFITPDTTLLLESIKAPALEMVKNIFKSSAKEMLKKHLVQLVEIGINKVIDPESLEALWYDSILPIINTNLLRILMRKYVELNLNKFVPLFHKLLTDDPANRETNTQNLQQALITEAKGAFRTFDPNSFYANETPLSDEDWRTLTQQLVDEFESTIIDSRINNTPFDAAHTSANEIKDILKHYFQDGSKENDPVYGEITMNLLFKAGNINHEGLVSYFIKDAVSTQVTSSVKDVRSNHKILVHSAADALKSNFLDPQRVKDMFNNVSKEKAANPKEKFAHQVNVTARLTHELIMRISEQKGAITAFAVRRFLTDKPDMLDQLMTKVYKKVFGERFINENLAVLCCDELFRSFA